MGPIAAGVLLLGSVNEQRQGNKAARRANRAQERAAAIQNARSRRRSRAEATRVQATNVAQGAAQGVSGSSTLAGITASVQTQLASNISFQQQLQALDTQRFSALESSLRHQSRASTFTALSNFAGSESGQRAESFIKSKF